MSRITGLVPRTGDRTGALGAGSANYGTAAALALAVDPTRQFLQIQNNHATQQVGYTLDGSTPVLGAAGTFVLAGGAGGAGGSATYDTFIPTGAVNIIASGATTPVTVISA